MSPQTQALAQHLNKISEAEFQQHYQEDTRQQMLAEAQALIDAGDYDVLTDEEADKEREKKLDNYIEDVILPEIPAYYRFYFNEEARKDDARMDGRGHSIAGYDGEECYEDVDGTTYYIYRQG